MKTLKDIILESIHKFEYDPAKGYDSDELVVNDSDFEKLADDICNNFFNQNIDSLICNYDGLCYKKRNGFCVEQDIYCSSNNFKIAD